MVEAEDSQVEDLVEASPVEVAEASAVAEALAAEAASAAVDQCSKVPVSITTQEPRQFD